MIEMIVGGLGFDPRNLSPLVLLRDQDELNFLPIWIGVFEAAAVAMELQGVKPPRPMTHDLLQNTIDALGGKIKQVAINDVKDGTFFAVINVENKEGTVLGIDARPSDAIALAVRCHAPIFVAETVMVQAKLVNSEKDAEETKKFNDFVQNIRPEDFTKYYNKD
ncbi:MAG: bifunctional nuclease family protein [Candidatus Margulisbacteria bacterium]|nr:bifunctional nuclease family protein [Candidatus Margulisiibacteriota bacterium]